MVISGPSASGPRSRTGGRRASGSVDPRRSAVPCARTSWRTACWLSDSTKKCSRCGDAESAGASTCKDRSRSVPPGNDMSDARPVPGSEKRWERFVLAPTLLLVAVALGLLPFVVSSMVAELRGGQVVLYDLRDGQPIGTNEVV